MTERIPVSVIVTTKNEASRISRCLEALEDFCEVLVVDSQSEDETARIAVRHGATVVSYRWDGRYPKKRQWCLDTLTLQSEWVFFIDADEVVTRDLSAEVRRIVSSANLSNMAGFFVQGRYVWQGRALRYGMRNNKLAFLHRRRVKFPEVDDLDCPGMGEIEGHYQPLPVETGFEIGQLREPLLHYAYEDERHWEERHHRYAQWEACMTLKNAWPRDPLLWREGAKRLLRTSPLRGAIVFLYSYVFRLGFLDGQAGLDFAKNRAGYSRAVLNLLRNRRTD
ncbi:MAG: glycosyltransferase family 2 protein [Rhodospirillales bacterium]|nr:glycosyltransferase family 2 protein [Alphaproteobacteria bacterium]MCB9976974.1 glycosyltransferase family 2 protein [Rhodospirillales bacterium]